MNRENISRLILDAGNGDEEWAIIAKQLHKHFPDELEAFSALVASAERERIKQANAPEIERINAHIKELEDAVKEALAQPEQSPYHHFVSDRFNIDPQTGNLNIGAVKKQEPVAWRAKNFYENQEGWFYAEWHQDGLTPQVAELLYTTPPQRKPLTDKEIAETLTGYRLSDAIDITRAIEDAHGIKGQA